ncbi:26933_t:CDS:2, partial [Racocetra persica]
PFYLSNSDCLSPLQESILEIIGQLDLSFSVEQQIAIKETNSSNKHINREIIGISTSKKSYSIVSYIAFFKTVIQLVKDLFKTYVNDQIVYLDGIFRKIMK